MAREYSLHTHTNLGPKIDFRAELNPQQCEAVVCPPGQALVIAGAGSGKTRTLIYRVAYLLANGVLPEQILLLTFTNKAAREMLERVQGLLSIETGRLWGGTFHSIGNRILRQHAERLNYKKGFSIMDREDQKDLLSTVITASGFDAGNFRFPKAEVVGDMISLSSNTGVSIQEIIAEKYPYFDEASESIRHLHELYCEKKSDTNCVDFDDLLALPTRLLMENQDLRERYQRQFEFVLVDEYQDTNQLQCEFIDAVVGTHGNLMAVGDDAQSIYSWRGADVRNILGFTHRYPRANTYKIETNYRSVPEVLALANAAIAPNRIQIRKELTAARKGKGLLPAVVPLDTPSAQAAFVGQRIHDLIDEGADLNEIAVIYRAHFHSLEIQLELTNRGIPFQITSGLRFFEQAHVKDVAAFMKFAVNRSDEVSFMRLVRLIPGIGGASATKLWSEWTRSDASKMEKLSGGFSTHLLKMKVPKKAASTWEQFGYTLDELLDTEGNPMPPASMIRSITEGVYEDYMKVKFNNYEQRVQDLDQLSAYSDRFTDTFEFLTQLALVSGVDTDESPTNSEQREKEAVTLTTGHQAKGLEWRSVFVVWLAEGMFPHKRALESGGDEALEEERRLFYVAVTLAKDELYLTYPVINHQARDGDVLQRPSRFLKDLPPELIEQWQVKSVY